MSPASFLQITTPTFCLIFVHGKGMKPSMNLNLGELIYLPLEVAVGSFCKKVRENKKSEWRFFLLLLLKQCPFSHTYQNNIIFKVLNCNGNYFYHILVYNFRKILPRLHYAGYLLVWKSEIVREFRQVREFREKSENCIKRRESRKILKFRIATNISAVHTIKLSLSLIWGLVF